MSTLFELVLAPSISHHGLMQIVFGLHYFSIKKILNRVLVVLDVGLSSEVSWPSTQEMAKHKESFKSFLPPGFDDVACAVDGTEIEIPRPNTTAKKKHQFINCLFAEWYYHFCFSIFSKSKGSIALEFVSFERQVCWLNIWVGCWWRILFQQGKSQNKNHWLCPSQEKEQKIEWWPKEIQQASQQDSRCDREFDFKNQNLASAERCLSPLWFNREKQGCSTS